MKKPFIISYRKVVKSQVDKDPQVINNNGDESMTPTKGNKKRTLSKRFELAESAMDACLAKGEELFGTEEVFFQDITYPEDKEVGMCEVKAWTEESLQASDPYAYFISAK